MEEIENPFLIQGYISDYYFCNRKKETEKIVRAFKNGRNCTMFSIRKYGKSGLISHVFHQNPDNISAYIDLFATQNITDLVNAIGKKVLPKIETRPQKLLRWVGSIFSLNQANYFHGFYNRPTIN